MGQKKTEHDALLELVKELSVETQELEMIGKVYEVDEVLESLEIMDSDRSINMEAENQLSDDPRVFDLNCQSNA